MISTPNDFRWDGYFWTTTVRLDAWRGWSLDSAASSDGTVDVTFAPEGRDEAPLREAEVELVRWAVRHEREMQNALLAALLPNYSALRADYADAIEDERLMPPVRGVDGFRPLIGLHSLNVHQIEKAGRPYVGLRIRLHVGRRARSRRPDARHARRQNRRRRHCDLLWIAREDAASG